MLVIAVSLVRARVLVVVIVQVVHDDVHRDRRAEEREDEEGEETKGRARHYELVGAKPGDAEVYSDERQASTAVRYSASTPSQSSKPSPAATERTSQQEVEKYQVVRLADEIVVDLLKNACGVDYARASAGGIETKTIEGVPIPVGRKELLIETQQTVRPTDAADVQLVRLRIAAEGGGCNPPSHASTGTLAAR